MKITLPNGSVIELDDTPSKVSKQVDVAQADDVVGERTSSGDPVATEKRQDKAPTSKDKTEEPAPRATKEAQPKSEEKRSRPKATNLPRPVVETAEHSQQPPAASSSASPVNYGGQMDTFDPLKGKAGVYQYQYTEETR
jgi:hypothetical protein